jgi:ADP-dependent NAD(P)H-hydrate dehydratase
MPRSPRSRKVTRALLDRTPLPAPQGDDDKESRGRVLVIGGEVSLPGAVVLAGIAALRAGAGKLQIATCRSIAAPIGVAVPESLSLGLKETRDGSIHPDAASSVRELVENVDALVIGPGMTSRRSNTRFTESLLRIRTGASVVLDAGALQVLAGADDALRPFDGRAVITPHRAEMASILGAEPEEISELAPYIALHASATFNAVIALKGATTFIATPDGDLFRYECGDVGLATSGSGDTLAGIVAGLLARGADPVHAALWAVWLHGEAGNKLAKRIGRIGYLARELLDEIPPLMRS